MVSSQSVPISGVAISFSIPAASFWFFEAAFRMKLAPIVEALALVAGAPVHRREGHDAEREALRLAALVRRHERARPV